MNKKVYDMEVIVFLLLMVICIGLIYVIHKYFGKTEFYLLAAVYSIISFLMSFKVINIFGVDINGSAIFSSGLLVILYYFINRYNEKENKRFIAVVTISTLMCIFLLLITSFMVPSIFDLASTSYQDIVFDNLPIVILYPITNLITLFLSSYCFRELKKENKNRLIKTLFTLVGVIFVDTFIFSYFIYAILIKFDVAIMIALDNYLIKTVIMVIYLLIVNKLFMVRKVK